MKHATSLAALAAALSVGAAAHATSFTNGNFETNSGAGQLGFNTSATGWTTSGYNFLYAAGTADSSTTAASGVSGRLILWGPTNGSNNGLPATSPAGGYFIGADGDFDSGAISQTISGLTIGKSYTVGFYYGFAQQYGYNGSTIQSWSVSLGDGASQSTASYDLASHGFSGWMHQDFTFTADATTETLSFLAHGNLPVPPFALLDGVTFSGAPEPATWTMMLAGVLGVGGVARRRRAMTAAMAVA